MPREEIENEIVEKTAEEIAAEESAAAEAGGDVVAEETPEEGAETEKTPEELAAEAGAAEEEGAVEKTEEELAAEAEAAKGFKPNIVFKAGFFNKESKEMEQKEHSIDPKFHAIMKDPESEKLVRELHEKAFGLDSVKERMADQRSQLVDIQSEKQTFIQEMGTVRNAYQKAKQTGDWHKMDTFFEKLNIPQEDVLRYAMAKAELANMEPAQQHAVRSRLQAERQAEDLEQNRASSQTHAATLEARLMQVEMEAALNSPAILPIATAFDAQAKKPGAFRTMVLQEGELAWLQGNRAIRPMTAVQSVIQKLGLTAVAAPAPGAAPSPGGAQAGKPTVIVKKTDKVIPNVSGRTGSPLKSRPKSLAELEKYRKETYGS